jgi:hypothetical protein
MRNGLREFSTSRILSCKRKGSCGLVRKANAEQVGLLTRRNVHVIFGALEQRRRLLHSKTLRLLLEKLHRDHAQSRTLKGVRAFVSGTGERNSDSGLVAETWCRAPIITVIIVFGLRSRAVYFSSSALYVEIEVNIAELEIFTHDTSMSRH